MDFLEHKLGIAIHIEPERPIALPILLSNLKSLGDEYHKYSTEVLGVSKKENSKLYVGSISPGSIDILLQPEYLEIAGVGLAIATSVGPVEAMRAIGDFADFVKLLLERFEGNSKPSEIASDEITISDCNNAINFAQNVVDAGGSQTINVVNVEGDFKPVISINESQARRLVKNANQTKAILEFPSDELFQAQALVWKTFDKSPAKKDGQRSPDKGIIESIDPKHKAILFADGEEGLKSEIINSDENPMQMVYYVDVEVVKVDNKVKAYRIVKYHSREQLSD